MKLKTCMDCNGKCCRYVITEIETPKDLGDFEDLKWYVAHKNVNVFVEKDKSWNLEFVTPCKHLDKNNRCKIYKKRPQTCKDHLGKDCELNNPPTELFRFKEIKDVEEYIEEIFKKGLHNILKHKESRRKDKH
jgi:Fe-S-cluster containining protein